MLAKGEGQNVFDWIIIGLTKSGINHKGIQVCKHAGLMRQ